MNAQTAARQTSAPQTPSLPHAKPEALGLSTVGLQRMSDAFKREIDKGTVPGVTVLVARRGQIGWFEALGKQSPDGRRPDGARHDLPHLLDDQADRLGRHHDAGRGRALHPQRPRCKIHPGICRLQGRRRKQRQARARAGEAADDGAGPAAAHVGPDLRPHRQRPCATALPAVTAAQPQDHQRRTRDHAGRHAADLPARRGMELQPLHRHPRTHHRSHLRQVARRVPDRTDPGAAANDRNRIPYRRSECRPPRRTIRDRSLERRQGAALQHAGKAGHGIRRRRTGFDHDGLCAVQPDAAQRRYARRQQDHRPQDAGADGVQSSRPRSQDRLSLDAGRSRLRSRLRGPHPSGHGAVHGIGRPVLLERNGRNILLDRPGGRHVHRVHDAGSRPARIYPFDAAKPGLCGGGVGLRSENPRCNCTSGVRGNACPG